jgi:alkylation response protein AidB-like acyl-CoA dehydrogenase
VSAVATGLSQTDARRRVLNAARELAPELSARAAEGEALRTMPPDLVARAKRAGLFRLALPRSLGGFELDPATLVEVVEELSRADGSAGWTLLIGNATLFFAWLEPGVARAMIGTDVDFASTSMFGPFGQAVPISDSDFAVSGRWPFNSGCPHAEWLQVGVMVMDGQTPRLRAPGVQDWRFAFVRRQAADIEDTWRALGLRGTGSHHLSMSAVKVPQEHLAAPLLEPARHAGPLWRLPGFTLATIMMVGFPLGVGRRALDEFATLAGRKARGDGAQTIAQDGYAQAEVAAAEAALRAARSFVFDVIGELWTTACAGDPPSVDQRGRMLLASGQAMRAAVQAVDVVFHLAGASAVYDDQPLQRCFRDIHTANQHLIFSTLRDQEWARVHFGLAEATFFV